MVKDSRNVVAKYQNRYFVSSLLYCSCNHYTNKEQRTWTVYYFTNVSLCVTSGTVLTTEERTFTLSASCVYPFTTGQRTRRPRLPRHPDAVNYNIITPLMKIGFDKRYVQSNTTINDEYLLLMNIKVMCADCDHHL